MARIKMFLGLFVIISSLYTSFKLVPPYFSNYQFQDAIKDEATHDSYVAKSEDDIRDSVFRKAQDFEIPIPKDSIKVQRSGLNFNGTIIIHAPYVVHVDLPGYPMDLHFDASTENKGVF
jgi:hypothetical protein